MTITPRNTTITAGNTLVREKTRISNLHELETTPSTSRRLDYVYAEGRIVAEKANARLYDPTIGRFFSPS